MEGSINPLPCVGGEGSPLLPRKKTVQLSLRYSNTRKCLSSKSALLTLFWSFLVGLWNEVALSPDFYLLNFVTMFPYSLLIYGYIAVIMLFSPFAGCLADLKCGRYKIVVRSMFVLWLTLPFGAISSIVLLSISSIFDLSKAASIVLATLLPLVTAMQLSIGI